MELASYLAGERWSDHPRCTHPLLASVCRLVNDLTSDGQRSRLAALIPCVIGLTSDDRGRRPHRPALRPDRPADRRGRGPERDGRGGARRRAGAGRAGGPAPAGKPRGRQPGGALASAPLAAHWARSSARGGDPDVSVEQFRRLRRAEHRPLRRAAVARACVPDPDRRLYELLVGAIDDCAVLCGRVPVSTGEPGWTRRAVGRRRRRARRAADPFAFARRAAIAGVRRQPHARRPSASSARRDRCSGVPSRRASPCTPRS